MEFLKRNNIPTFTPRLDLTAEELNQQTEIFVQAINELAGRIEIMRLEVPEQDRGDYAEENTYPILDNLLKIWAEFEKVWTDINDNKTEIDQAITNLSGSISSLERRLNTLDDSAARKEDLAVVLERVQWIRDNMIPKIVGGVWYVGNTSTGVNAVGPKGDPGEKGDTGATGAQGLKGEKGNKGLDGTSFTIKGTVDAVENLPTSATPGDAYFVGTEVPRNVYSFDGATSQWINQGNLKGPDGKSAFEFAEDGGYTGDENQFAEDLANVSNKVDKVEGKGLSTNDYTTLEKNKLTGIAAGAEVNVQSDFGQTDDTKDDYIKNKPSRNHNDTENIQGGVLGQRYHITEEEHTNVVNLPTNLANKVGIDTDSIFSTLSIAVVDEFPEEPEEDVLYFKRAPLAPNTTLKSSSNALDSATLSIIHTSTGTSKVVTLAVGETKTLYMEWLQGEYQISYSPTNVGNGLSLKLNGVQKQWGLNSLTYVVAEEVTTAQINIEAGEACLEETTLIDTPQGSIAVKDIELGDTVTTTQDTDTVDKVYAHYTDKLIIINNDIKSSMSHIFKTTDGYKSAIDIKVGDVLVNYNSTEDITVDTVDMLEGTYRVYEIKTTKSEDYVLANSGVINKSENI